MTADTIVTSATAQTWVTNELVAYYPFIGNANDATGNGNNGVVVGSVNPSTDRFGRTNSAYNFDGNLLLKPCSIDVTNAVLNLGSNYTVSMWFMSSSLEKSPQTLFNTTPHNGICITYNHYDAPAFLSFSIGSGDYPWAVLAAHGDRTNYLANSWHSCALVKEGISYSLYVDGQFSAQVTIPAAIDYTNVLGYRFGSIPMFSSGNDVFDGSLDDIRIYNCALSSNAVAQLYAIESRQPFLTNGLVAYYPFNGNANDAIATNDGIVYGPTLVPDRYGIPNSAYTFNGSGDNIQTISSLPDMVSASVSCWINVPRLDSATDGYVFMEGDTSGGHDFIMAVNSYTHIDFKAKNNTYVRANLSGLTNTWIHVVSVADNTTSNVMKLWIDGRLMDTSPSFGNANSGFHSVLYIGCLAVSGGYYFKGIIDDMRFYDRALSDFEVVQLYAHESALIPLTPLPPTIASQPQSATVNAHGNTSFNVTASGTMPLSYQWSLNGTNILGATAASLTNSNVTQDALGAYAVVVGNAFGSTTSSNAFLSMRPYIHKPFLGAITYWGKEGSFSVEAWGSGPLRYQWYWNGATVQNATNQTLSIPTMQFTNAGLYSVVVSSALGSVTNTPAEVVVNPAGVALGMFPGVFVTGVVGYTYSIQATSDLSNTNSWTTVATLTLMQPVQLWVDTRVDALSPTNPHKYYKVVAGY